jgi:predicted membrane protein
MTGYIILGAFIFWIVSTFGGFLFGYAKGRKKEQAEQNEKSLRKAASDKAFEVEKEKIREEVFGNAEQKKHELSGNTGRARFNAVNNSLRDTTKN